MNLSNVKLFQANDSLFYNVLHYIFLNAAQSLQMCIASFSCITFEIRFVLQFFYAQLISLSNVNLFELMKLSNVIRFKCVAPHILKCNLKHTNAHYKLELHYVWAWITAAFFLIQQINLSNVTCLKLMKLSKSNLF